MFQRIRIWDCLSQIMHNRNEQPERKKMSQTDNEYSNLTQKTAWTDVTRSQLVVLNLIGWGGTSFKDQSQGEGKHLIPNYAWYSNDILVFGCGFRTRMM